MLIMMVIRREENEDEEGLTWCKVGEGYVRGRMGGRRG
jgi:hypothetical protein